jgi:hypothetical protein
LVPPVDAVGITALRMLFRACCDSGAHGVEMDISTQLESIGIGLNKNSMVSALEKMAGAFAFDVVIGRIGPIDVLHDLG